MHRQIWLQNDKEADTVTQAPQQKNVFAGVQYSFIEILQKSELLLGDAYDVVRQRLSDGDTV